MKSDKSYPLLGSYDIQFGGFDKLMPFRIREILLVSSPYDSSSIAEDDRLTELIFSEYLDLRLHYAPRVTRAASLKPHLVPPHAIRRTFATVAYLEGVPLDQIQAALMHADPAITLRYIRVAIPAVQRVGTTVLDAAMKASREKKR